MLIPKSSAQYIKYIDQINLKMSDLVKKTNLELNDRLSYKYKCNIFLKREDQQRIRSFKLRGAYNKILKLQTEGVNNLTNGIICASAGNHAQGVALSAKHLNLECDIYIPDNTPLQKINRIKHFSDKNCRVFIGGETFNDCLETSLEMSEKYKKTFIHPYDDIDVINGQATIAKEIYDDITPDIIIGGVGGGGLLSGTCLYSKSINNCQIYGVEPETCPSLAESIRLNTRVSLDINDTFVDGATVSTIGKIPFEILKNNITNVYVTPIGLICKNMVELYKEDGIITEPAGALPISALDFIPPEHIKGKNVVCIISGGNNDITRYPEILDRMMTYQGLKHYYIIQFIQKPGLLKNFINKVLGPHDDIVRFEYIKKTNREFGDVLVGIEITDNTRISELDNNLKNNGFLYTKLESNDLLYSYLI